MKPDMKNSAKDRMKNGEKISACWLHSGSPIEAEIVAQAGFDMIVADLEHGPMSPMDLIPIMQVLDAYDVTSMVRAPWNDLVVIKKILDCGAEGIHIPYVGTAEETQRAVEACKYPKLGNRGVASSTRAAGYGSNRWDYLQHANDMVMTAVAIENQSGIDSLDAMMEVKSLDAIFIGPMDLSTNLGYAFSPNHPDVTKIIRSMEEKVLDKGLLLGTVAADARAAEELFRRGYSYVIFGSDTTSVRKYFVGQINEFKGYREQYYKK